MLSLLAPPTLTIEEETQRAHIFHRVVYAIVSIAVVFLTLVAINQPETILRAAGAAGFVIFLGVVVLRLNRRRTRLAAVIFAAGLISLITALAIASGGGMRSPGATMYFVIVVMTGLLLGQRAAAVTAVVCAVLCLGLVLAERFGLLMPAIQYESTTLWWLSCLYMGIVVVLMSLPRFVIRNAIRYTQSELFERKRTEQDLLEKQKLLQTMIEDTPAAVAMFDTQMRYIAYSRRWLVDYRLGDRDLKGLGHYDVFPEIGADWKAIHKRCMAGAMESREEDPFQRGDGTEDFLRWVVQPWQKGSGEIGGLLMLTEVITDRVRALEERRSLRDQLQQAQKMDALGTLAGGIAHDFNNLLAVIATNAEAGCFETSNEGLVRNSFEEIKKASARANDLVKQIISFSRKQTDSDRKIISLLPIVTDALALLRATLPTNVEFQIALGSSVPTVAANATQVYQVVINLGTNAGQAMPIGGVLTLSLDHIHLAKTEAAACGELRAGEYVRVAVQDTGVGMTQATINRIFEPFFTTKGTEGTGLGLSVVHGLVKDHDGAITIESELGKGSTFRVYFPAVRADAIDPPPRAEGAVRGNRQHVLYIDDEAPLAHAQQRLLRILGYRCTVYSDPEVAVNAFRGNADHFDAVIVDVTMPRLSGIDVAKELRAIRPNIPIALTSGSTSQETLDLAASLGLNVWLPKPATVDKLCHTLDVLLQKRAGNTNREE